MLTAIPQDQIFTVVKVKNSHFVLFLASGWPLKHLFNSFYNLI